MRADLRSPMCSKMVSLADFETHLSTCLARPRVTYNEDTLDPSSSQCLQGLLCSLSVLAIAYSFTIHPLLRVRRKRRLSSLPFHCFFLLFGVFCFLLSPSFNSQLKLHMFSIFMLFSNTVFKFTGIYSTVKIRIPTWKLLEIN